MSIDSNNHNYHFSKRAVANSFNRAVNSYDSSALLQQIVGGRLFDRLDLVKIKPELILDLGCGTGYFTHQLQQRYQRKQVLGVDLAWKMSSFANDHRKWLSRERFICADAEILPLENNSVELVFSNLMIQWITNPDRLFREMQRILVPGGLMMFTCFGPDTLKEMRLSWSEVDDKIHVNQFQDMHDIGDSLSRGGFDGIVMDNETITMNYESLRQLHQDLRNIGAVNINSGRNQGLTSRKHWKRYLQAYEQFRNNQGDYIASWDITYGHAWAAEYKYARKDHVQIDNHTIIVQDHQD